MSRETLLRSCYLANAALLIAHEIDSAYWREWELFGLDGGIGGFVLAHVPLALAIVWGYGALTTGRRAGLWMSALLALGGLAAGLIHGTFLYLGHPQFRTPVSVGVIAATVFVSLVQSWVVPRALRR
jgi:hypothetical protein